jgi:hypothetical protein
MPIASQISQLAATDHGARHNPHRRSRELASFCGYDGERAKFRLLRASVRYRYVKRSCFGYQEGCTSAGGGSDLSGDVVGVGVRLANHRDAAFATGDIDPLIGCVVEEIVSVADDVVKVAGVLQSRQPVPKLAGPRHLSVSASRSSG